MFKRNPFFMKQEFVEVEDKNRFYYMLQQMQANRWKITGIVLFLFFFIVAGINSAVFFGVEIGEDWKEMLLILLGAFKLPLPALGGLVIEGAEATRGTSGVHTLVSLSLGLAEVAP